jgi:sensor histidine kinase YesM
MTLHEFLFTKKMPGKYFRHIAFWIAQFIFWCFWATVLFNWKAVLWLFKVNGFFIIEIIYTYLIAYFLSPRYLVKNKIFKFIFSVFILTIFTYVPYIIYHLWVTDSLQVSRNDQLLMTWFSSMNFIINGPPVICAMFLTIKMLKNYYIKIEEKRLLTKENADAELQLLKAQVHPHFLFNTLNNIYSFALNKKPQAGVLVLKLSNTLKYMINDCEAALVPLEKELKMIEDYISLEKVRYGDRLEMQLEITGDYKNKLIAPLLLIPFVENSFKHGSSKMLKHPWIKLYIFIKENAVYMDLSNSSPLQVVPSNCKNGIGLKNVKKRLELLFPGQHELSIQSTDDKFLVHLQIPLEPIASIEKATQVTQTSQILNYA